MRLHLPLLFLAARASLGAGPYKRTANATYTAPTILPTNTCNCNSTDPNDGIILPDPPLSNGLALTPPMGWSSWNQFGDAISESLVKSTIDSMVSSGLQAAGYIYVNLDDGWQRYKGNRSLNPLEADPEKFPNGIKSLADYAHSKGFKLGIYNGPGQTTCAGYTGSEGHEEEDAQLFGSWGIDHLKYDSCCSHTNATKAEVQTVHLKMSSALLATGRGIVYHACHCGWVDTWEWGREIGANQWRIGQDISDDFNYPGNREKYYFDVLDMLDRGNEIVEYSGPGGWNDYDMLIVGLNGNSSQLVGTGCSNVEYRTHFSMWAMVSSPLLIGSDVRKLDKYELETLTNKEIIAISQDELGVVATVVKEEQEGDLQTYAKELKGGSYAIAFLNRGSETMEMGLNPRRDLQLEWDTFTVRDIWKKRDRGPYDVPFSVEVMPHEARVFRVAKAGDGA